jgi:phosphatidylethanolamine-binding protein (PEBP) family uncharacterized protein
MVKETRRDIAIDQLKNRGAPVDVASRSFGADGPIPAKYADYGGKVSPELSWTGVPSSAKSVVTSLNLDPGATAAEVLAALECHVVARGELIGTFEAPRNRR